MKKNEQKIELNHVSVDLIIDGMVLRIKCDAEDENGEIVTDLNKLKTIFHNRTSVCLIPKGIKSINGISYGIQLCTDGSGCNSGYVYKHSQYFIDDEYVVGDEKIVPNATITNVVFVCQNNKGLCGYSFCFGDMQQIGSHEDIFSHYL